MSNKILGGGIIAGLGYLIYSLFNDETETKTKKELGKVEENVNEKSVKNDNDKNEDIQEVNLDKLDNEGETSNDLDIEEVNLEEKELEERIKKDRQKEKTIQENSDYVIDISSALQEDISNNITLDISENYKVVPGTHAQKLKVWANAQFFKSYGRKAIHPDEITRFLEEKGQPDDESLDEFFAEERV